jgi:hypothetical protein
MSQVDSERQGSSTAQFWIGGKQLVLRGQQIDALWDRIDSDASLTAKRETIETVIREVEP